MDAIELGGLSDMLVPHCDLCGKQLNAETPGVISGSVSLSFAYLEDGFDVPWTPGNKVHHETAIGSGDWCCWAHFASWVMKALQRKEI